jgi:L-lysine 2,3-aminomutase
MVTNFVEPHRDQLLDERLWQRAIGRKVQRALRHRVSAKFVSKLSEDRPAERQVAQVVPKRGEARNHLAMHAEGGNAVRDALVSLWDDLENRAAQRLKGSALRLVETA